MNILFVCVGNVFRSYCAERFLNKYSAEHNLYFVASSAGIAPKERANVGVSIILEEYGITDSLFHVPKKVNKKILKENDLIIAMSSDITEFLREQYHVEATLYNKIAHGLEKDIDDVPALPRREDRMEFMKQTIHYIHESTPHFTNGLHL